MSAFVLVGVPGAGKSTVGKLLAQKLGIPFVDIDEAIETRAGKSVSDIFIGDGEPVFRELEERTIAEELQSESVVLSLGGGALGSSQTRDSLHGHIVIWLQTSLSQAVARVGMNRNRPLLLGNVRGQLAELMTAREPIYREAATIAIETSNLSPDEVVEAIISLLPESENT
jgi:shikimate kinase